MFLSTSTLLLALSAAVSAVPLTSLTSHNVELDRRATFKNQQNAIDIARRATILPAGSYTFKAVTSGNWVTYRNKNGQSFFPDTEATYGSPISFEGNADGLAPNSTRFMPTLSNYKCVSSQWDYVYDGGANWAGVLYMCAVGSGPVHTGLRPEKQWHYLLSTSGLPQGPSPYYVIPVDHVKDMKTRGFTDCIRTTATASSMCMDELDDSRTDQIWDIQPYSTSGAPKPVTSTTAVRPTTSTVAPPPPAPTTTDEEEDTPAPTVSVDATTLFKTRPVGITPIAPNPKAAIGRVGKIVPTQA